MVEFWGESCQGEGQLLRGRAPESQSPDGKQLHFLVPWRIFGTIEVRRGETGLSKGLLAILEQKVVCRLETFVSLKGVYVTF